MILFKKPLNINNLQNDYYNITNYLGCDWMSIHNDAAHQNNHFFGFVLSIWEAKVVTGSQFVVERLLVFDLRIEVGDQK